MCLFDFNSRTFFWQVNEDSVKDCTKLFRLDTTCSRFKNGCSMLGDSYCLFLCPCRPYKEQVANFEIYEFYLLNYYDKAGRETLKKKEIYRQYKDGDAVHLIALRFKTSERSIKVIVKKMQEAECGNES